MQTLYQKNGDKTERELNRKEKVFGRRNSLLRNLKRNLGQSSCGKTQDGRKATMKVPLSINWCHHSKEMPLPLSGEIRSVHSSITGTRISE